MPVELITERLDIEPNHVFVIPEKRDLHVLDGEFLLKPSTNYPRRLKGTDKLKKRLSVVAGHE
jgi:hypothetical protein